jgi:prepilin-type N-terminal cleavage/methylation domain-containing protein
VNKKLRAFTLLELIIAMALLGVVFVLGMMSFDNLNNYLVKGFKNQASTINDFAYHVYFLRDSKLSSQLEYSGNKIKLMDQYRKSTYHSRGNHLLRKQVNSNVRDSIVIKNAHIYIEEILTPESEFYLLKYQTKTNIGNEYLTEVKKDKNLSQVINEQVRSGQY